MPPLPSRDAAARHAGMCPSAMKDHGDRVSSNSNDRLARRSQRFDADWSFHLGHVPAPLPNTHLAAYMANKAGWARGAARRNFDDSDWRIVQLPHDWSVEGPFDPDHHVDAGYLPRGTGWYRRHFRLDGDDRGRYLAIRFDGVASHCTVYLNGHLLHRNFCGYTSFAVDVSDVVTFGDDLNVVAVHVDATYMEGWWYEGAGIYRHVWLINADPLHVATDGVFIRPERRVDGTWRVTVEAAIENASLKLRMAEVTHELFTADGRSMGRMDGGTVSVGPRGSSTAATTLDVNDPPIWSLRRPNLCTVRTRVVNQGVVVDEVTTRFGFRTRRFDPAAGFFLNGEPVKLKGTCNHQDHAGVGVAVPDSIHRFRIQRLLDMGCNAIRCAHNPPAPELLDACDELGMLVMDEARNFGTDPEVVGQLRSIVRRDRNHPSVILWSICNEEAIQGSAVGGQIAAVMQEVVHQLDPSRPVTAAVSGGILNPEGIGGAVEVVGINYQLPLQERFHAERPATPLLASETHCVLSTRGVVRTDPLRHHFAASGSDVAPWGATAQATWRFVSDRPYVAGLFIWTGFDYRGEPTPHAWPCIGAQFGLLDLCGFDKDGFHLHRAYFSGPGAEPFIHLAPHWNHPAAVGDRVTVVAHTNADAAELFLNGASLGRVDVDPIHMARWQVPYAPGTLRAVAFRGGKRVVESEVATTETAIAIGLEVHPSFDVRPIPADGRWAIPVTAFAVDDRGRRVPTANSPLTFTIDGPGRIVGVGNGDPASHEPNQGTTRSLFNGLAQVIVQTGVEAGTITLRASSPGLTDGVLHVTATPVPREPTVAPVRPRYWLADWRMSPVTVGRPDPNQASLAQDMNSWERVNPAQGLQSRWAVGGGHALYRATVTVPKSTRVAGASIAFSMIAGAVEAFVDGRPVPLSRRGDACALDLPTGAERVGVTLLVTATNNPAGLGGRVELVPAGR
jgi:beta-galactosidase